MGLGISEAVQLSGGVIELLKNGLPIELQERIMELREVVLNAKDEVLKLREENAELKRTAARKGSIKFDGELYWQGTENGRDGLFCQRCYDNTAKQVRLQREPPGLELKWRCLVCGFCYAGRCGPNVIHSR